MMQLSISGSLALLRSWCFSLICYNLSSLCSLLSVPCHYCFCFLMSCCFCASSHSTMSLIFLLSHELYSLCASVLPPFIAHSALSQVLCLLNLRFSQQFQHHMELFHTDYSQTYSCPMNQNMGAFIFGMTYDRQIDGQIDRLID